MGFIEKTDEVFFVQNGKSKLLILTNDTPFYTNIQKEINFSEIELVYLNTLTNVKEFVAKLAPNMILINWEEDDNNWLEEIMEISDATIYFFLVLSDNQQDYFKLKYKFRKNIFIYPKTEQQAWLLRNLKSSIELIKSSNHNRYEKEISVNILNAIKYINGKSRKEEIVDNLTLILPKILPYDFYGIGLFNETSHYLEIFKQFEPPESGEFLIHNQNFENSIIKWLMPKKDVYFNSINNIEEINQFRSWGWRCEEVRIVPIVKGFYLAGFFLFGNKRKKNNPDAEVERGIKILTLNFVNKLMDLYTKDRQRNYQEEFSLRVLEKELSEDSFFMTLAEVINELSGSTLTIFWQLKKGFNILFPKFIYSPQQDVYDIWKKNLIYLDDNWLFRKIINDGSWEVFDFIAENKELPAADIKLFAEMYCHHVLAVPFKQGEEVGVFTSVTFEPDHSIKPWYLNQLENLVSGATRLYKLVSVNKEAEFKFRQLNRIFELGNDLKIELNQAEILKKIVLTIRKTLGWNDIALLLYDSQKILRPEYMVGFNKKVKTHLNPRKNLEEAKVNLLLAECDNISNSFLFKEESTANQAELFELSIGVWNEGDEVIVPIETSRSRLGYLVLKDPIQRLRPDTEDMQAVEYFANQAAVALENSILFNALKNSEERYKLLAETMPLGLVTCESDGTIIYANPKIKELLNVDDLDIKRKKFQDFLIAKSKKLLEKFINNINEEAELQKILKDFKSGIELEITGSGKELNIPLAAFITPIGASADNAGFFMVLNDIRMQKRLEKMKENFNSMIVHDLRSPLNVIQGFLDLMLRQSLGKINGEQSNVLKITLENVRKVLNLVDNFLIVSKMKAGRFSVTPQLGDLNNLIHKITNQYKVILSNKNIKITVDLNENIPLILFDEFRLEQVLNNLLSNAVKYVQKDGNIILATNLYKKTKGENETFFVEVTVLDNGAGIPEDKMDKIFKVFEMAHEGIGKRREGTGLGLAICKEIVEAHDGEIWVESEINQYTKFHFILPIPQSQSLMEKEE